MNTTNEVKIQLERLKRHLVSAKTGDKIAFLDLANSLRIFADLKLQIDGLMIKKQITVEWPNLNKNKKIKKILNGSKYFEIPLVSKEENLHDNIQIRGAFIVDRALSADDMEKMFLAGLPSERLTNLTFSQWLNSEVVYTTDKNNKRIGITREILIRRVSNLLGGSHPSVNEKAPIEEKFFNSYIKELNSMQVAGGYPVTYYQLIEIAEIITDKLDMVLNGKVVIGLDGPRP